MQRERVKGHKMRNALEAALQVKLGLLKFATQVGHALLILKRLGAELFYKSFRFRALLRQSCLQAKGFLIVLLAQSEELTFRVLQLNYIAKSSKGCEEQDGLKRAGEATRR